MIKKFLDITFLKFVLVGVINTLVGTAVMFLCYNALHLDYWFSSAMNYVVGSIVSYFLNKYFTFQNKERSWRIVAKLPVRNYGSGNISTVLPVRTFGSGNISTVFCVRGNISTKAPLHDSLGI